VGVRGSGAREGDRALSRAGLIGARHGKAHSLSGSVRRRGPLFIVSGLPCFAGFFRAQVHGGEVLPVDPRLTFCPYDGHEMDMMMLQRLCDSVSERGSAPEALRRSGPSNPTNRARQPLATARGQSIRGAPLLPFSRPQGICYSPRSIPPSTGSKE